MELYREDKYKVWLGKGERVGLSTVWGDPEIVLQAADEVMDKVAIMGSLYSKEGVNIMLRNLGLNPEISRLYLWGNSPLSQTKFGQAGQEELKKLWKEGVSDEGEVLVSGFELHEEFEIEKVREMIADIELIDISQVKLKELSQVVKEPKKPGERERFIFKEHQGAETESWPSELAGWTVRGEKVAQVWLKVVDRVMRYGVVKETEGGSNQKELLNVSWVVSKEDTQEPFIPEQWPKKIKERLRVDEQSLKEYYPEFLSSQLPEGTAYTYGQRLWAWEDKGEVVNQIEQVIEYLKESPVTRRAVVSTWKVGVDGDKKTSNPPCLVMGQFIQSKDKLHLLAVFRSHDIFKAGIPNAFGLRRLQEEVADRVKMEVGKLVINSVSTHLYEEDWGEAEKLLACEIWERPVKVAYEPGEDGVDPRGNVLIRIKEGKIELEVVSKSGEQLIKLKDSKARKIAKKLAKLDLLSLNYHWLDIGMELQKAQLAIKQGVEYEQDKPLQFETEKIESET